MSDHDSIPTALTGKQRWNHLVELERIKLEIRSVVLFATVRPRETTGENYHWARDLRRGRTNVFGGFFRLVDIMARRGLGSTGRQYALRILALARDYVDLVLPDAPAPEMKATLPVIYRPPVPVRANLTVVRKSA